MKKLISFILISVMMLSLAACGSSNDVDSSSNTVMEEQQTADGEQSGSETGIGENNKENNSQEKKQENKTEQQETASKDKSAAEESQTEENSKKENSEKIKEEKTSQTKQEETKPVKEKPTQKSSQSNSNNKTENNKTENKKPSKKTEQEKTENKESDRKPEKEEVKEEKKEQIKEETKEENKEDTKENKTEEDAKEETMGQILLTDFKTRIKENPSISTQEMADALLTNEIIQFMSGSMPVEPGWLSGFSADITGFKEGVSFGPMMGSIAFIGYIFELEEGSDVEAFVKTLKDNADPRWQICVEAEETVTAYSGNTVFFLMCPRQMESN